jgi:rhodanese-related sulfurtransferase
MNIKDLVSQGASIVDVRTPEEFMGGNVANSINVPLHEVPERVDYLKSLPQPLVLCCLSGGRSGQATAFLSAQGINCINGGGWMDVNGALN